MSDAFSRYAKETSTSQSPSVREILARGRDLRTHSLLHPVGVAERNIPGPPIDSLGRPAPWHFASVSPRAPCNVSDARCAVETDGTVVGGESDSEEASSEKRDESGLHATAPSA